MARVTAVFANHAQADAAIAELRQRGVTDSHLSIVAKRVEDVEVKLPEATHGERIAKGAITASSGMNDSGAPWKSTPAEAPPETRCSAAELVPLCPYAI